MTEYFKGFFLADHTLHIPSEPAWQKMGQSACNRTQPVDTEEEDFDQLQITNTLLPPLHIDRSKIGVW